MMHSYSISTGEREQVGKWLIGLAALAAALWGLFQLYIWQAPWWVDTPAIIGFYEFLKWLFVKKFWTKKMWLWKSGIPNLTGTWHGSYDSTFGQSGECVLIISQDWERMGIHAETDGSRSDAICSAIVGESKGLRLEYSYENRPKALPPQTMNPHLGFARLHICELSCVLDGEYFTDGNRGTAGAIKLRRLSKQLLSFDMAKKIAGAQVSKLGPAASSAPVVLESRDSV